MDFEELVVEIIKQRKAHILSEEVLKAYYEQRSKDIAGYDVSLGDYRFMGDVFFLVPEELGKELSIYLSNLLNPTISMEDRIGLFVSVCFMKALQGYEIAIAERTITEEAPPPESNERE